MGELDTRESSEYIDHWKNVVIPFARKGMKEEIIEPQCKVSESDVLQPIDEEKLIPTRRETVRAVDSGLFLKGYNRSLYWIKKLRRQSQQFRRPPPLGL